MTGAIISPKTVCVRPGHGFTPPSHHTSLVVFLVGSWGFGEKYLHIIADADWIERRDKRVLSSRNAKVVAFPQSEKQIIPVRNGAARNAFQVAGVQGLIW
jgi:hypothetical protein